MPNNKEKNIRGKMLHKINDKWGGGEYIRQKEKLIGIQTK